MAHPHEHPHVIPDNIAGTEKQGDMPPDLWTHITSDEAPLVRAALVRAHALGKLGVGPNDAYLQGIADALGFKRLQKLQEQFDIS